MIHSQEFIEKRKKGKILIMWFRSPFSITPKGYNIKEKYPMNTTIQ